jgi:hypothetical protein
LGFLKSLTTPALKGLASKVASEQITCAPIQSPINCAEREIVEITRNKTVAKHLNDGYLSIPVC